MKDQIKKTSFVIALLCGLTSIDARHHYPHHYGHIHAEQQDWTVGDLRHMGDPKVYMNDAPKGYTEHIKYDRTKYRRPTKKELAKEEAQIYK